MAYSHMPRSSQEGEASKHDKLKIGKSTAYTPQGTKVLGSAKRRKALRFEIHEDSDVGEKVFGLISTKILDRDSSEQSVLTAEASPRASHNSYTSTELKQRDLLHRSSRIPSPSRSLRKFSVHHSLLDDGKSNVETVDHTATYSLARFTIELPNGQDTQPLGKGFVLSSSATGLRSTLFPVLAQRAQRSTNISAHRQPLQHNTKTTSNRVGRDVAGCNTGKENWLPKEASTLFGERDTLTKHLDIPSSMPANASMPDNQKADHNPSVVVDGITKSIESLNLHKAAGHNHSDDAQQSYTTAPSLQKACTTPVGYGPYPVQQSQAKPFISSAMAPNVAAMQQTLQLSVCVLDEEQVMARLLCHDLANDKLRKRRLLVVNALAKQIRSAAYSYHTKVFAKKRTEANSTLDLSLCSGNIAHSIHQLGISNDEVLLWLLHFQIAVLLATCQNTLS